MKDALASTPDEDFKPPKTAKLMSIRGHVEAFAPGTEPRPAAPVAVSAPGGLDLAPTPSPSVAAHPLMTLDPPAAKPAAPH